MKYLLAFLFIILFAGCRHNDMDEDDMQVSYSLEVQTSPIVYYGDINNDAVVAIDTQSMQLQSVISSSGIYPYEVKQITESELYVINRDDFNLGLLDSTTDTIEREVSLNFKPRSIDIHNDDILVSSANEPSSAIVRFSILSGTYGDSEYVEPTSFGGSNATGHPLWIDDEYFLLLDRTQNTIELYKKWIFTPVSKITTLSSVHHVMSRDGYYYGIAEGKQNSTSPGVVKFSVEDGKITLIQERLFSSFNDLPSDFISSTWGAHHGAFHPSEDYIYVGSAEGNVFVMELDDLDLVDTFKSGKGVGHILFYNDILITTNHYDNFKSFYHASNPEENIFLKNLQFGDEIYDGVTMQSHTSHIVDDKLYFTFNTGVDSTFYKVDLATLSIEDSLVLEGRQCLMGSFVQSSELVESGM